MSELGRGRPIDSPWGSGPVDRPREADYQAIRRAKELAAERIREAEAERLRVKRARELEAERIREAKAERARELAAERAREAEAERLRKKIEEATIKARTLDLTAGRPEAGGRVTVQRARLGSDKNEVRVVGTRGFQVGNDNLQENTYRFEIRDLSASIDDVVRGNSLRERAFANLVDNPGSRAANREFRRTLQNTPLFERGDIEFKEQHGIKARRVAIHTDSEGSLVIENSQGVQRSDNSTQRNYFKYIVKAARFSAETAFSKDPKLTRDLAIAARDLDCPAVQRSIERRLQAACANTNGQLEELYEHFGEAFKFDVTGDGVQFGEGNKRKDKIITRSEKLRVEGWGDIKGRQRREADYQESDQRVCKQHQERIAKARPAGCHAEETAEQPAESMSPLIRWAAAVLLDHLAPGREYLAGKVAAELMAALGNVRQADVRDAAPGRSFGAIRQRSFPARSDQAMPLPEVDMVPLAGAQATGVVVWGSEAAIARAQGVRALNGDVLLRYVRQRIWALHRGGTGSAATALQAAKSLRAVLFLDPSALGGLWLDVDPMRQALAAALPIYMDLSADPLERFAVFADRRLAICPRCQVRRLA
jgi:hypothetical protein